MPLEIEKMTFAECRSYFTHEEIKKLEEYGQHIVVTRDRFKFGDEYQDSALMEKFTELFRRWIDSQRYEEKVSAEGLKVVKDDIFSKELEARKRFPEVFNKYQPEDTIREMSLNGQGYYDITGLFLTFLSGIGIEIRIEEDQKNDKSVILYGKHTGVSIFTDATAHSQMQSLQLPGQQRFELRADGQVEIVCDDDAIIKALKNVKSNQGYDVFLLQVIGSGIMKDIDEHENRSESILIPRKNLQESLGITIKRPTQEIINFILNYIMTGKDPKTDVHKKLYAEIVSHYKFWIDLLSLTKAGVYKTDTGIYSIFTFEGYNETEDTIECNSPYLRHVYRELKKNKLISSQKVKDRPLWEQDWISPPAIRGSFYKVGSETTQQICEYIIKRISTRGTVSDAKKNPHHNYANQKRITIRITYQQIIDECSLLKKRLTDKVVKKDGTQTDPDANYKRIILNRAIWGKPYIPRKDDNSKKKEYMSEVESVFRTHTDYFDRYVNFQIKVADISLKTLSKTGITITHEGKNGEYYSNPELTKPDVM